MATPLITSNPDAVRVLAEKYKELRAITRGMDNRPNKSQCKAMAWRFMRKWMNEYQEAPVTKPQVPGIAPSIVMVEVPLPDNPDYTKCIVTVQNGCCISVRFD